MVYVIVVVLDECCVWCIDGVVLFEGMGFGVDEVVLLNLYVNCGQE